jgi:hypothetical protein
LGVFIYVDVEEGKWRGEERRGEGREVNICRGRGVNCMQYPDSGVLRMWLISVRRCERGEEGRMAEVG